MKIKNITILLVIFALITAAAGCGQHEIYGEKISNRNGTSIKDILTHPEIYVDKTVVVKGKIAIECETGCWFNFKEGDAIIYVNLESSGFAIPQRGGRNAIVEGTVTIKDRKPVLIGKGVRIL
jgi:hypothetical protein